MQEQDARRAGPRTLAKFGEGSSLSHGFSRAAVD